MSVHIGELRTEVRSAGAAPAPATGQDRWADTSAEQLAEAAQRAEWLACRVAADGSDD
jgi:hypothetical protein